MAMNSFMLNEKESFSTFSATLLLSIIFYVSIVAYVIYFGYVPSNIHLYFWGLFIPVCYILPRNYFRYINAGSSITRGGSRLSDVMVFLFVSQICVSYLSVVGIMGFLQLYKGPYWDYGNAFEDKLFGQSPFITEWFLCPIFVYQAWLLLFALLHKEFRTKDFLIHHICTLSVALVTFMRKFLVFYIEL